MIFDRFDEDGSGTISIEERCILQACKLEEEELQRASGTWEQQGNWDGLKRSEAVLSLLWHYDRVSPPHSQRHVHLLKDRRASRQSVQALIMMLHRGGTVVARPLILGVLLICLLCSL